ncbi:ABC transporter ATP-binding protein [Virgibacillus byunsanensis]|uniref:ABC transporter ATP-binding protein n=1 Tax=Virgibacillus byunsanensis TaxID=570945 RepID=A0ABW3LK94_9BACI
MNPLIKVDHLYLHFENQQNKNTLSNVSFQLEHNESMLILGPSGCGKSTLTFCLNGLYPRELDGEMGGDIFINGRKTTNYRPGEISQSVGVVFQDPETQFCMLTVEDEVAFGLENICVPHEVMDEKVDEALRLVNMLSYKRSTITSLSGGQKQKLALACILALEPSLLILDEPTANLDPIASKDLISTIHALKNKTNCALIIIEHQLDGWVELADRSLLLNRDGEVFYDGSLRHAVDSMLPQIEEQGVWLPKVTQYVLNQKGFPNQFIPLTIQEFLDRPYHLDSSGWETVKNVRQTNDIFIDASTISWSNRHRDILRDVSLQIYKGEFIAIIGANGSGKTSLSRILAGIQKPTTGTIHVRGKALKSWKESHLRAEVGYVFQNPEHQFITNTVFDEVAFSLRLKEYPQKDISEKVEGILETCRLSQHKDDHPYSLSQGQKRRLSVATMMIDNQNMLLLDEPTFGQDAQSNLELMKLLEDRHSQGTTMVVITHDMEIVHHYATRVVVLNEGRVVADCSPLELWEKSISLLQQWQLDLPVFVQLKNSEKEAYYVSTSS